MCVCVFFMLFWSVSILLWFSVAVEDEEGTRFEDLEVGLPVSFSQSGAVCCLAVVSSDWNLLLWDSCLTVYYLSLFSGSPN